MLSSKNKISTLKLLKKLTLWSRTTVLPKRKHLHNKIRRTKVCKTAINATIVCRTEILQLQDNLFPTEAYKRETISRPRRKGKRKHSVLEVPKMGALCRQLSRRSNSRSKETATTTLSRRSRRFRQRRRKVS